MLASLPVRSNNTTANLDFLNRNFTGASQDYSNFTTNTYSLTTALNFNQNE